jgi:hypothetical protein
MLLPASSSNGKTLLTARLLSLGCEYCSDEAVLLRRDGTVRPIPTALSVKTGGAEALSAHFPGSLARLRGFACLQRYFRADGGR